MWPHFLCLPSLIHSWSPYYSPTQWIYRNCTRWADSSSAQRSFAKSIHFFTQTKICSFRRPRIPSQWHCTTRKRPRYRPRPLDCQYELSHLCRKDTSGSPWISRQTPSHMPAQKCTNRTTIDGLSQKIQTTKQKREREAQPSPPVLRSRDYITSYFAPAGDTEGSLRFRRTRKK